MRNAACLVLGLCALGCSVPSVEFYEAGVGASVDARIDAPIDADASRDAPADSSADSSPDSSADAPADVSYCGDAGSTPPNGTCCPGGGPVCAGKPCNRNTCASCANCSWPKVCCILQGAGVCEDVALCP